MKHEKGHRYVSTRGPLTASPDPAIVQAIAAAENEGWPIAITQRHALLAVRQLPSAQFATKTPPH